MADFSLNPDINLETIVRFIAKGSDAPLTGSDYTVRLYDKDIFDTDFIGESGLDANGYSKISFTHKAFGSLETFPDLYFALFKSGEPVFKSKLMQNIDLADVEKYKKGEGEVIDLGTFLVEG